LQVLRIKQRAEFHQNVAQRWLKGHLHSLKHLLQG